MKICATRYKPEPRSGKSKGLELVLDAHNDIIDASTIPNDFEVQFYYEKLFIFQFTNFIGIQGFEAVIDSRNEYTMTKSDTILIRPGHTVRYP